MMFATQIGLAAAAAAAVLIGLYAFALLDRARRREARILAALAACGQAHQLLQAERHALLAVSGQLTSELVVLAARVLHPDDAGPLNERLVAVWRAAQAGVQTELVGLRQRMAGLVTAARPKL